MNQGTFSVPGDLRGVMNQSRRVRFTSFLAAGVVAVMALGANGCSRDSDQVTLDFSKTLPVARPQPHPEKAGTLRGAVAAMISPRETFIHYRHLLAYLAEKSGKDLEFVQRKTYEEISELLGKGESTWPSSARVPMSRARTVRLCSPGRPRGPRQSFLPSLLDCQ